MKIGMGLIILWTLAAFALQNSAAAPQQFYGTYAQLRPAQKKLIDDWYAEYNKMMQTHDNPADYDQLSLSTRTTFEAVTHALLTTKMTSKTGQPEGNASDLMQSIETINGKVPKARGDLQFRMYVVLKPDALQKLKDSSEFFRDRDNTVYHHGYPMNYRQDGGVPSIQVSIAKDGRHADIDVDYRSSRFPTALINGHLTAANSDVRAGNNTQRHLQRWDGLTDWWHNLFGWQIRRKRLRPKPVPRPGRCLRFHARDQTNLRTPWSAILAPEIDGYSPHQDRSRHTQNRVRTGHPMSLGEAARAGTTPPGERTGAHSTKSVFRNRVLFLEAGFQILEVNWNPRLCAFRGST